MAQDTTTYWYVEPRDEFTNRVISNRLAENNLAGEDRQSICLLDEKEITKDLKTRLNLLERVKWLQHQFKQSVLIEEFIDGREFTVSVLGNNPPKVLPIVEQNFEIFSENMPRFASYETKWFFEDNLPDATKAYHCPAPLTKNLQKKIEVISLKVFSILNCKDVIRIDYRMDKNENIFLLEVNTLPGLNPKLNEVSYLPIAARTTGFSFEGLVNTILNEAVVRYGLLPKKKVYHVLKNYWPQKYLTLQ